MTDARSVEHAIRAAGPIEVLVSNAGGMFVAAVEATPRRLLQQNTVGVLRVVQAVLPGVRDRGHGRLLFMSSILRRTTRPTRGAYAASNWALEALVEILASEVPHFGVEVALLEPSSVASGALEMAPHYSVENDPYGPLETQMNVGRAQTLSVEEVATAIGNAIEAETLPLRIPIGEAARQVAPDDVAFLPAPVTW